MYEVDIDGFEPALLFPSRRAVPQTMVDGIEARAIVGVDDGHQITAIFSRLDGLWYLTALVAIRRRARPRAGNASRGDWRE